MGMWTRALLALALAISGCGSPLKAVDVDGDGLTPWDGDCWDDPEGPAGSGLKGEDIHPNAPETWYDGIDQNCDGQDDYDQDGDGADWAADGTGVDCDDADPDVYPGATEVYYDEIDQDCDGGADDYDQDGDGAPSAAEYDGGTDCDDTDASFGPDVDEIWYDGIDQNCDDADDYDQDGDGYESWEYTTGPDADCDDEDDTVNPGADEVWYDDIDEDCNGGDDFDQDKDGYDSDEYGGDDCDDLDDTISPEATEVWYDGVDQDCDGRSDYDQDKDGYIDEDYGGDDCDDLRSGTHPEASEVCNFRDDDCNGVVDDGSTSVDSETWYRDADEDGYGDASDIELACDDYAPDGYVLNPDDCDDDDPDTYPDAEEIVGDEIDEDCDDEEICYQDNDGDGYRTDLEVTSTDVTCTGTGEAKATTSSGDCNDDSTSVNPGKSEITGDEIDENCDGKETCYQDNDNDGYRTTSTVSSDDNDCADSKEATSSDPSGDCNDSSATVYPAATETVADGIDENCDGYETCYVDSDHDTYRSTSTTSTTTTSCVGTGLALSTATADCDDTSSSVHPTATETVADGIDEDCDGYETCYVDSDHDTYRSTSTTSTTTTTCVGTGLALSTATADCDDSSSSVHPTATETVADGIDGDCDGYETCYVDFDGDGYRSTSTTSTTTKTCVGSGLALSSATTDCDDTSSSVHTGATETVADGIDENCDGSETCYIDKDKDGDRSTSTTSTTTTSCATASGYALSTATVDCDDNDSSRYSTATEVVADGKDENCDLKETCYVDFDMDGDRSTSTTSTTTTSCATSSGYALSTATVDCDDADSSRYSTATEIVADGKDEDCDLKEICYIDSDKDGDRSTSTASTATTSCATSSGYALSTAKVDCADSDATRYSGATETDADGIDQNCDDLESCYVDSDRDGYRTTTLESTSKTGCLAADGYAKSSASIETCDSDATRNPGVTEIDGDGIDEDCDSYENCYVDGDHDGDRDTSTTSTTTTSCVGTGLALSSAKVDCDDGDGGVNSGATELPGDGVDQNCDDLETCYVDSDGDGYRTDSVVDSTSGLECSGDGEALADAPTEDCDDDPDANPGEIEHCDAKDDDCDGQVLDVDVDPDGLPDFTTGGMAFAGLSDDEYLSIASDTALDLGTSDFAIEMWVYANGFEGADGGSTDPSVRLIDRTYGSWPDYPLYALDLDDTDGSGFPQLELVGDNSGDLDNATTESAFGLSSGTWTHIAVSVDRTANTASYYINGELMEEVSLSSTFSTADVTNSSPLYISSSYNGLDGYIDELRIWGVARSTTEIDSFMCAPISSSSSDYADLILYMPFEPTDTDDTAYDKGPNAFANTVVGSPTLTTW